MAKIFYSLCGEGRGHAARVRTMVEHLRNDHEMVVFAPEQAYEFLSPLYPAGTRNVDIRPIPGLRFHYTSGRLDLLRSIGASAGYLWRLPRLVRMLRHAIDQERPDLTISDFEPALPRAARACQVPFVSLNHQHFLVACDLSFLPWDLRNWAAMMGVAVRAHHRWQRKTIVSSFFEAPLKPGHEDVLQVGPLLRRDILEAKPEPGGHLVSYLRPSTPARILEMLSASGRDVRVYGLGKRPAEGRMRFFPLDQRRFVDDLATCDALVGAAGNQSLGEAIHLGKPVLALPEADHHEQMINSCFLARMGAGDFAPLESADSGLLGRFLGRLDPFRQTLTRYVGTMDGAPKAIAEVMRHLPPTYPKSLC